MRILATAAAITIFALPVLAADPAPPAESEPKRERAAELALEATQKLMLALELLIQSLPQYGLPYIDEDGSIIIPRLPDTGPEGPEADEEPAPGPQGDPI